MTLFSSLLVAFFTSTAWAAEPPVLMLDITLKIDEEVVSKPKLTTLSGEPASIKSVAGDESGFFIEVTPTLRDGNQVHMQFALTSLSDGTRKELGKPQVVSLLGQAAEITQGPSGRSSKTVTLAVTPTLKD